MDKPYTVSLQGVEDLPAAERRLSEARFMRELERSLGEPASVLEVWRAWRDACESDPSELGAETARLAVKWPKAFDAAQRAALQTIGESDAHFELRIESAGVEAG